MLDGKAFGAEMTEIVKGYVDRATAPLLQRIETLEKRQPEKGEKGDPGEGIKGETGVGVAGALIDRSGVLILTLSDGTQRDLGVVVGKDGRDGQNGAAGLPGEPGKDGLPGSDGFSLDDYDEWLEDGGRTLVRRYECGDTFKEFRHQTALPIDRGVFKQGETYQAGDSVSWGSSLWIAQKETVDKPDGPDSGWRLAVKKGRDGKDAK